ncbi:MAG: hypothetical protein KC618_02550 [Candidatus Omnitrophica bacterium]|nr:hypothetical protein [Candidatus Omnitrophota bacterium]
MSETEHTEINPMNYLKIIFQINPLLVIPAFIGLVIGICAGMILPREYKSSTVMLIEEGRTDNPLFGNLAVATTVRQRLSTVRESMLGWNSMLELIRRLGMDKDIKTPKQMETLILKIRGDVDIRMRGNNIIQMGYLGPDRDQTYQIVKNLAEIFIDRNIEVQNQETADAISFIEDQLQVYRGKIKSAEIAKLKDELRTLQIDSTDLHPRVKQLKELIRVREDELRAENLEYVEDINLDTESNNTIIQEIRRALESVEGSSKTIQASNQDESFYKMMLLDKLDTVMARDASVNDKIYNMLLSRLETAKITQRLQASKEGAKYTILDPPRLPLAPVKPDKLLVALAGLAAGLGLGLALVFSMEFLDKSFIDVEEAKGYLGKPLLGAISKINVQENIRAQRERAIWLYTVIFIIGVITIIITKTVANFIGI